MATTGKIHGCYYALALVPPFLGIVLFVTLLLTGVLGIDERMTRFVAPGERELELQPATYTIFYEYRSTVDGRVFSTGEAVPGLRCAVFRDGEEVQLRTPAMSGRYNVPGHSGTSVLEFTADRPGRYKVEAWYPDDDGPEVVLAVGTGFGKRLCVTIAGSIAVMLGSFLLGAIVFAVVFVKRRRASLTAAQGHG